MYTGYLISDESRNRLLKLYPPKYSRVLCHHITRDYPVKKETIPEVPTYVMVVGYIDSGDGVEGFLVEIDGSTQRPDGKQFHITHSIDETHKPVDTNNHVDKAEKISEIQINVTPKYF
jgi:hypothetical protein